MMHVAMSGPNHQKLPQFDYEGATALFEKYKKPVQELEKIANGMRVYNKEAIKRIRRINDRQTFRARLKKLDEQREWMQSNLDREPIRPTNAVVVLKMADHVSETLHGLIEELWD